MFSRIDEHVFNITFEIILIRLILSVTCCLSKHNLAPPCTRAIQSVSTILLGDEPKPIGKFTPTCDEDGFFAPMQCNRNNDCWCVDRNGAEIKGARTKGFINCGNFFLCHLNFFSRLFLQIFFLSMTPEML